MSHSVKELSEVLAEFKFPDSIFDVRLFLTGDGRKRGLWLWLQEDNIQRIEADSRYFQTALESHLKWLKSEHDLEIKDEDKFMFAGMLRMHFDYALDHRTEARAIRLSWPQVKKLAAALLKAFRDEKHKSDD